MTDEMLRRNQNADLLTLSFEFQLDIRVIRAIRGAQLRANHARRADLTADL